MKHALHVAGMLLLAVTLLIQGSTPAVFAQQPIDLDSPGAARTVGQPVGRIPSGTAQWFQFDYSFTPSQRPRPTVTVRLLNGVQNKLQFEIWSPERLQGTWADNEPVGRGMPEIIAGCFWKLSDGSIVKCTTDHLVWVGGFGALGTYYIRVLNTSDVAIAPQVIVSGPGLGQCVNPSRASISEPVRTQESTDGYVQVQCEFPPETPTRVSQVLPATPTLTAVATPPATLTPTVVATSASTPTTAPTPTSITTAAATQNVTPTALPVISPTGTSVATSVPGGATVAVPTATAAGTRVATATTARANATSVPPATALSTSTLAASATGTSVPPATAVSSPTQPPSATAIPSPTQAPGASGTAVRPPTISVPTATAVSVPTQASRATAVVISSPTAPPSPTAAATRTEQVTAAPKVAPSATAIPSATQTTPATATTVATRVPTPTPSPVPTPTSSSPAGTSASNQLTLDITISSAGHMSIGGFDMRAFGLQPLPDQANQVAKQLENAHLVIQNDQVTLDVHSTPVVKMQWGPSSRQVLSELATRYGIVVNSHVLTRLEEWISSSNIDVTARYTDEPSKAVRASLTKPLWIDIGNEGQLTVEQVPLAMTLDPTFMRTVKQSGHQNVLVCWNKGTLKIKADGKDLPVLMLDANGVGAVSQILGLRIENSLDPLFQARFGLDISLAGAAHQADASCGN